MTSWATCSCPPRSDNNNDDDDDDDDYDDDDDDDIPAHPGLHRHPAGQGPGRDDAEAGQGRAPHGRDTRHLGLLRVSFRRRMKDKQ